jgi:hypothetical protein
MMNYKIFVFEYTGDYITNEWYEFFETIDDAEFAVKCYRDAYILKEARDDLYHYVGTFGIYGIISLYY